MIVSLLDLHPSPRPSSENLFPPLEILEAGTGHGALTLHLARAIHAANPPLSEHNATKDLIEKCRQVPLESAISMTLSNQIQSPIDFSHHEKGIDEVQILSRNTSCRQAIIHTIDISPRHSEYATKIVRGFRRGQYANDVDFHVGDVSEWIDHQRHLRQTDSAFLSHIILDMPSSQVHVEKAASALCVNGSLIVFNPSITQITACVKDIKDKKLPLQLEHVLELGPTMTGGREWDVRAVKPRAIIQAGNSNGALPIGHNLVQNKANENMTSANEDILGISLEDIDAAEAHLKEDTAWEMVCRPKVGDRVIGGGFLGVWEKMRERKDNPVLDSIG